MLTFYYSEKESLNQALCVDPTNSNVLKYTQIYYQGEVIHRGLGRTGPTVPGGKLWLKAI